MNKKKIAYLLAASMLFSSVMPVYGTPLDEKTNSEEQETTENVDETQSTEGTENQENAEIEENKETVENGETTESEESTENAENGEASQEGQPEVQENPEETTESIHTAKVNQGNEVKVVLGYGIEIPVEQNFEVRLTKKDGEEQMGTLSLPGNTNAIFENVETGEYTLEISGDKYETYSQSLNVKELTDYTIPVTTGWLGGYDYDTGAHPGVIRLGDADGDGKLTDADADAIIQGIESEATSGNVDLNSNGKVDMVDLQCFAVNSKDERGRQASVEEKISPAAVAVEVDQNKVQVNGNLESVLTGEGSGITLKPAEGELSEEHPVQIDFPVSEGKEAVLMEGISIVGNTENPVTSGSIEVELEDGKKIQIPIPEAAVAMARNAGPEAKWENGVLVVDFKGQVAVKKVTLVITGTKKNNNLAEISKVEFLNDMENRIPAPAMDIPEGLKAEAGSESFILTWNEAKNITGYEVKISDGTATEIRKTASTKMEVLTFNNDELVNGREYKVSVQSVNGEWKSGYSQEITVVPFTTEKPAAPDNLTVSGGYRLIKASWKKMKDTDSYNLY